MVGFREELIFQAWLNINLSATLQNVRPLDFIILYPISLLLKRSVDFLKEGSTLSGYLTKYSIKENKTTGKKKRYCIFKDNFIFYYSSDKSGTEPSGLFMIDYYTVKKNIAKKSFELVFQINAKETFLPKTTYHTTYVLSANEEQQIDKWNYECLSHSANGISNKKIAVAVSDFSSDHATLLSFSKGNILIVMSERDLNGNYVCRLGGKEGSVNENYITFDQEFAPPPAFGPEKNGSITPRGNTNNNNSIPTNIPPPLTNAPSNVSPPTKQNNTLRPPPKNPQKGFATVRNINPTNMPTNNPTQTTPTYNQNQQNNNQDLLRRIEELERRLNQEIMERKKLEEYVRTRLN